MTKGEVVSQIDALLNAYQTEKARAKYDDLSDLGDTTTSLLITRIAAGIDRFAPTASKYRTNAHALLESNGEANAANIPYLLGILRALREDYVSGFLATVEELIHGDIFSDFLEMGVTCLRKDTKIQPPYLSVVFLKNTYDNFVARTESPRYQPPVVLRRRM